MKKLLNVLLVLCLCLSLCQSVFAIEPDLEQVPDFYDAARLDRIERLKADIEISLQALISPQADAPVVSSKTLNVPLYQQPNYPNYYCGPACTQMALSYFGISISQSTLAGSAYLNTDVDEGTYVYKIENVLNGFLGGQAYQSVLTTQIPFFVGMKYSIDKNLPVICHVHTSSLPNYNGYGCNHYVIVTGYFTVHGTQNGIGDVDQVYYNDPHNNNNFFGQYVCTYYEMTKAINDRAGFYIMGR